MSLTKSFGKALKKARVAKKLTQEDFSDVSSRTYMSSLERGIKSPTIEKLDSLAKQMKFHPVTLLTLTYLIINEKQSIKELLETVLCEIDEINGN